MKRKERTTGTVVGVDVGGTKVCAALVDIETGTLVSSINKLSTYDQEHKKIIDEWKMEGHATNSRQMPSLLKDKLYSHSLENICTAIEAVLPKDHSSVAGIGIGCPGPLDPIRGIVGPAGSDVPPNLYGWNDVSLKYNISKKFEMRTRINGDVRVMALAEYYFGTGRDTATFMIIALGTGLGCGIVEGNKLKDGRYHTAGEIWKIPVCRSEDVGYKIFDYYGSMNGIARILSENVTKHLCDSDFKSAQEKLRQLFGKNWSTKEVVEAARTYGHNGHHFALEACNDYGTLLARTLAGPLATLDAEKLIIGGENAVRNFDLFHTALEKGLQENLTYPISVASAQVVEPGIIGAACLLK